MVVFYKLILIERGVIQSYIKDVSQRDHQIPQVRVNSMVKK